MIEIFILSLIQGITEFLPVSSSSHLILVSKYLNFNNQSLSLDVSLHIGSFIAVLFFFHKDILSFLENKMGATPFWYKIDDVVYCIRFKMVRMSSCVIGVNCLKCHT